jgi:DNA-binding winged helix-turn-helix (wHTH) protein/tetratricopeptide (TPR) repeat protein
MSDLEKSSAHLREYEFDDFLVDVRQRKLIRSGKDVLITSKVFSLLLIFVRNAGTPITKDTLMCELWPDSNVGPSNLTQTVFLLRNALGQGIDDRRYVVTIPGQGYTFTGNIKAAPSSVGSRPASPVGRTRSLAIIPFQILGSTRQMQYLGLGIADALTNRLSHLGGLLVRPTHSTMSSVIGSRDSISVGRELAVELLLGGTVQIEHQKPRKSSRVRVSAQLMDVRRGVILWSDHVEHELCQLLPLQDALAEKIGCILSTKLSDLEHYHLTKRYTENSEAYNSYLKGRYYANLWTERGWAKAIDCFTQAVEADPGFALAYSGIADAHYIVSNLYSPPNEVMPLAKAAAERSLELDPSLSAAHTSLALIHGFYDWNWEISEIGFQRAIMLDPGYPAAHLWYGRLLTTCGRFEEAFAELTQAQLQDPLSCSISSEAGRALFYARKYNEAADQLRETLELNPSFWPAHLFLGWVYEQQGLFTEALAILKQCNALNDNSRTRAFLGVSYALAGMESEAEKIIAHLIDCRKHSHVPAFYIGIIYAALGNGDRALRWLENAYDDRSEWLAWMDVEPRFDLVRSDPRFNSLRMKIRGRHKADQPVTIKNEANLGLRKVG